MAGVFDHDAAGIGDSRFDHAGVGVHVGDIDVAHENLSGNMNFAEARERIGRRTREVGMI